MTTLSYIVTVPCKGGERKEIMVILEYNGMYGLYEASLDGHVFVALSSKQAVIDEIKDTGFTEFIDRT